MQANTPATDISLGGILTNGGPVGLFVLVLLAAASLGTWFIIFERWTRYKRLEKRSEEFLKTFWESKSISEFSGKTKDMDYSPMRELFRSGYNEFVRVLQARDKRLGGASTASSPVSFETVKRCLHRQKLTEEAYLSRHLNLLGVAASAAPFIGLFGTVVGIIRAFHDIGLSGSSSLAAVAPGISEALIATALGLVVAIPAAIFHNLLFSRIRRHLQLLDGFAVDYLNIIERHYNISGGATLSPRSPTEPPSSPTGNTPAGAVQSPLSHSPAATPHFE